ncbi:MAG: MutS-related protein, partial [bacterium]
LSGSHDLAVLARALACLERERFQAPRLVTLRAQLDTEGVPPSAQVARFARLVDLLESRNNQMFLPLAGLLLWSTQLAIALEAWRARCGPRIASWVAVVGEMEALCALSAFAFENPEYAWPVLLDEGRRYEGRALAHPLLPRTSAVPNDVGLGEEPRLLLVSGSNMSGKSTLLRTVGVNLVLAQAGAPVRAASFTVSPLSLGSSIRVHDSLQEGSSRFYAEITRLRQVMELAAARPPLLFLLDEILHGTNSSDRRVGAEAVIQGLLLRGAIGLVTTHDLALAEAAEALAPRARNVHFEDHVEDGRIAFDYRMRDGVVTKSNALALMRAVGLEV